MSSENTFASRPDRCDLLVRADLAVTQDDDRTVVQNAGVAIRDGLVAEVGAYDDLDRAYAPDARLDLSGKMLLPGLVNAHTHLPMTLFRGVADDLPLMEWLEDHIWPVEFQLTDAMLEIGAKIGCAELIRTGCTAFLNGYFHEQITGYAASRRGYPGRARRRVLQLPVPPLSVRRPLLGDHPAAGVRLFGKPVGTHRRHPRMRPSRSRPTCWPKATPWPASWTSRGRSTLRNPRRKRPPAWKNTASARCGYWPTAACSPRARCCTIAWTSRTRRSRSSRIPAHPWSTVPARTSSSAPGLSPVQRLLDAGVTVGLGTDGASSNNQLNMFRDMGLAALIGKVRAEDASSVNAQQVLDMATRGSARCLGWPELGRIQAGCPADMIALELANPNLMPLYNPVSHAVYASTGMEVCMTMVAGQVLFLYGEFRTMDVPNSSNRGRASLEVGFGQKEQGKNIVKNLTTPHLGAYRILLLHHYDIFCRLTPHHF